MCPKTSSFFILNHPIVRILSCRWSVIQDVTDDGEAMPEEANRMNWYVLYTKPRNEKKTASLLQMRGIEVYCPTQIHVRQWSDRKKKVEEPVFRSYIFVALKDYARDCVAVLETPGAVRFLWLYGKPGLVRDWEIDAIRQFLGEYQTVESRAIPNFQSGDEVRVGSGPLVNQSGIIIRIQGSKAILKLQSLGIELTAELPVAALMTAD